MPEDCTLVAFLSSPREAFLSAVFRGLEACFCSEVLILSTRRRGDELRLVGSKLSEALSGLGVSVKALPEVPDADTSPEEMPLVTDWLRKLFRGRLRGRRVCFMTSTGSRLEVSSAAMVIDRSLSNALYVSFLWGPWRGSHYPYTPKPLQTVVGLHCIESECSDLRLAGGSPIKSFIKASPLKDDLPRLRREALAAQAVINSNPGIAGNPCITSGSGVAGCPGGCGSLEVKFRFKGSSIINSVINDYCEWGSVLSLCDDVVKQYLELRGSGRLSDEVLSIIELLIDLTGFRQLVVEDAVGCGEGLKGLLLGDALTLLKGWSALLDTGVLYKGVHVQGYDLTHALSQVAQIPSCALIELYEHVAQTGRGRALGVVRSAIASLILEEVRYLFSRYCDEAFMKPCEVGIALAARGREGVTAVTTDLNAYRRLYGMLGSVKASILASPEPLSRVRFKMYERSRRFSYAYYAVAQLKALSRLVGRELRAAGIEVIVRVS